MAAISLSLFGPMCVELPGGNGSVPLQKICQSVLAYLLLHPFRACTRAQLLGAFWGDRREARARRCLSTTLWRLKSELEPEGIDEGTYVITAEYEKIGFNWLSDHWLDVHLFETGLRPLLQQPVDRIEADQVRSAEEALELYRGELLEEHDDHWIVQQREHLQQLQLNGLAHLMQYYRLRHEHEQSLAYGQRILEQDPLREEIHRAMMRVYAEDGQRAMAVRQYDLCCCLLDDELGIPPMDETQRLYRRIVRVTGNAQWRAPMDNACKTLPQTLHELILAVRRAEESQHELQRALVQVQTTVEALGQLETDGTSSASGAPAWRSTDG